MTKNNITTIEGLAEMIQRTMASKEDIKDVREDIANVNGRLDRIEHLLLEEQGRKIKNLETRMKNLEDALPALSADRQAAGRPRHLTTRTRPPDGC
jgi:DNA-binding FrmR family transcriptional regulator